MFVHLLRFFQVFKWRLRINFVNFVSWLLIGVLFQVNILFIFCVYTSHKIPSNLKPPPPHFPHSRPNSTQSLIRSSLFPLPSAISHRSVSSPQPLNTRYTYFLVSRKWKHQGRKSFADKYVFAQLISCSWPVRYVFFALCFIFIMILYYSCVTLLYNHL